MMSGKMATLDLLRKKVFWKKGYDDFGIWHHQENLWGDSNYMVDAVMLPKCGKPSISVREANITSIL